MDIQKTGIRCREKKKEKPLGVHSPSGVGRDKIPDKKQSQFHLLLLRRLQSRQSIWQLEAIVRPPSTHGVM